MENILLVKRRQPPPTPIIQKKNSKAKARVAAAMSPDRPNLLDTIDTSLDQSTLTSQDSVGDSLVRSPISEVKSIIDLISSDEDSFDSPIILTRKQQQKMNSLCHRRIWDS